MKHTIVLATRNEGKVKELREVLKDFPIDLRGLNDFGPIPEAVEDGETFDENAYKKAIFTARVLGLPAISDDSGLVVKALNGAPGVYSARYAGENASDADNIKKLLAEMTGEDDRRAAFECVISLAVPSGPALTYEGRCEGEITTSIVIRRDRSQCKNYCTGASQNCIQSRCNLGCFCSTPRNLTCYQISSGRAEDILTSILILTPLAHTWHAILFVLLTSGRVHIQNTTTDRFDLLLRHFNLLAYALRD